MSLSLEQVGTIIKGRLDCNDCGAVDFYASRLENMLGSNRLSELEEHLWQKYGFYSYIDPFVCVYDNCDDGTIDIFVVRNDLRE